MNSLTLTAPAKLNLTLKVLGKRADGFHELDTLMVRLPGLSDSLTFCADESFSFVCSDPQLPTDESNLVVKAVRSFEQQAALTVRYRLQLDKKIPHGAGLGGGSSDAASTLIGLNQLHGKPLNADQLHQLAAGIGSDVAFFLGPVASRCTGRGEIIQPAEPFSAMKILLLKPTFSVSAGDAYRQWTAERSASEPQPLGQLTLVNDLEGPVFEKFPFLAELKQWLRLSSGVRAALMSGSGSTIFAVLDDSANPEQIIQAARQEMDPTLWSWWGQTAEFPA